MSFDVTIGTLFAVKVRVVVIVGEALDSSCPIFVWHSRLVQQAPRTFDDGAVGPLDEAIRLRAVGV